MGEDFKNLRQGSHSVQEYEYDFSRIVRCLPSVVRNELDKARCFKHGLRLDIYSKVQLLNIATYRELVDRSRLVEWGETVVRRECEALEKVKGKEKKRHQGGSGGQTDYKRPRKHQRQQPHSRGLRQASRGASFIVGCIDRRCASSTIGCAIGEAGPTTWLRSVTGACLQPLRLR